MKRKVSGGMKVQEFDFVIRDEIGIHARPAGLLAREASAMSSVVTVECNGKKAEAKKLFDVLELGVKCGDSVKVTTEGEEEKSDAKKLRRFFEETF